MRKIFHILFGHYFGARLCAILLHFILFFVVYCVLYKAGIVHGRLSNETLTHWDARWYASIRDNGYIYIPFTVCNMAFFPLFPILWKVVSLSSIWISVFNLCLFVYSFLQLVRQEKISLMEIMLLVSMPSFIFFFLPYSESLFFMAGTVLLLGIKKNNRMQIVIGLIGCTLTRSVSVVFIPAFIIIFFLGHSSTEVEKRMTKKDLALYISLCILDLILVALLQYVETGKWFYFFGVQQFWNRHLIVPHIPFTTNPPYYNLGMDVIAFTVGFFSILFCIGHAFLHFKKRRGSYIMPTYILFSLLFLSAITVLDVFFTYNVDNQTNLWSISRHLLCTPFLVAVIIWFWNRYMHNKSNLLTAGIILLVLFIISGVYRYFIPFIYFVLFSIFYIIRAFIPSLKKYEYIMYSVNLLLQIILFSNFLLGTWVA